MTFTQVLMLVAFLCGLSLGASAAVLYIVLRQRQSLLQ